ncbi:MAG: hypothetical protein II124_03900 [Clostridia bacterium]|nr:hypothetical protein [Clostridia bacterium]
MEEYENGNTFTDEQAPEEVKKLLQDAEDALKFENTDADAVAAEFDNVATRCRNCIKKLDELYKGGSSYETAKDALEDFKQSDMNFMRGYIPLFAKNKANKKMFESLTPNLSPDFTKGKMLYLDAGAFYTLFYDTGAMLGDMVDLKALFAFKMAYDNFEEEGFSQAMYNELDNYYVDAAAELTDAEYGGHDCPLSRNYYEKCASTGVLKDKEVAEGYWQLRRKDLINHIDNGEGKVLKKMMSVHDLDFIPLSSVCSKLQVIDRYTKTVYKHKDADGKIKELNENCKELLELSNTLNDKIKHPSSKNVLLALQQLYKKLGDIASVALDHYNKFKNSKDAPYVFMKYPVFLMGLNELRPGNSGGWDGGTKYYEAIWKLADALSSAFEDSVYKNGLIKRN